MKRFHLSALLLVAATSFGCADDARVRYPTADSPLRLTRVVLYRNGVGYFERAGEVDGDVLTIKVRKDQVNDLLKSLTVVERDTGRAVSVSMPLDPTTWANAAIATLQPGRGNLAQVLDDLRGTTVSLSTTEGAVSGRIVMVEPLIDAPEPSDARRGPSLPPMAGTNDHRVTLLDGSDLRVVKLSKVRSVKLEDGDLAMQFNRTLDASAGEGMFQQVAVSIRLVGKSSHDLLVSYVAQAPMWKPTYRVVLPKEGKGKALLQAWAVVDNTSGEDWGEVELGLTSGAPIAFRYDLHTPREVFRADLTETGVRKQAQAMVGETTFEPMPAEAPVLGAVDEEERVAAMSEADGVFAMGGEGRGGGKRAEKASRRPNRPGTPSAAAPAPPPKGGPSRFDGGLEESKKEQTIDFDSLRRSTMAQARAATVSGQTRFDIDSRVTVPDGTSTMVAIVNADVEGEETFLFRPGGAGMGYEVNPYRVVRFRNNTPFVLEPGPIAIYAGGSFVGEGLSETVGAGTSATIPFAVETGIMVSSTVKSDREEMRLIKISRGVLEVEQFARSVTTYTVKSQTLDSGFTLLVRHGKTGWNYSLATRPEGTEDVTDGYLVPIKVAAGSREGTISVTEQTPSKSSLSIWERPALELLEKLMLATDLTPEIRKRLQPIVDRRRELGKIEEQLSGLTEKRNKLDQRASELRANIQAIEKNTQATAQRQKWTKQLDEFTQEGNKLGAQLAELEAKRLDARNDLQDLLSDLDLTAPTAPAPKKP
jgi:hypothetical protein